MNFLFWVGFFGGGKWLEVNFPSRGKVIHFPQAIKTPFSQTLHFMDFRPYRGQGNFKAIFKGNYPLVGKFCSKDVGACAITTKCLDDKICTFKILFSWRFPRKKAFWTIFLSAPNAPAPLKTPNLFLLSSRCL